jgi:hypothetical protein
MRINNTIKNYWGFDSEFNIAKREVISLQYWRPGKEYFITSLSELKDFYALEKPKLIFGFKLDNDIGALELFTGDQCSKLMSGQQLISWHKGHEYRDLKHYANHMGLFSLAKVGDYLGIQKMDRDALNNIAIGEGKEIDQTFIDYAMRDAEITYRLAEYILKTFNYQSPRDLYTPAGFSVKCIGLPNTYTKINKCLNIPSEHKAIRYNSTYAGRSECFINGYLENYQYLDVASLYPTSVLISNVLNIKDITECDPSEINLTDYNYYGDYGWIYGTFQSNNDIWGIPKRFNLNNGFKQIRYCNGIIKGFYHSHDLLSSHAKILDISKAYKPIFTNRLCNKKYEDLYFKKINKKYKDEAEKLITKIILNSLTGKLAQNHPVPAPYCNYPAYNTIVATSHLIMSNIINLLSNEEQTNIAGMDTDSIFVPDYIDLKGELDKVNSYPIILDQKNPPEDLIYFRAKQYLYKSGVTYASHGWRYKRSEFKDLWNVITNNSTINVTKEIRKTLHTREKKAHDLPLGWWINDSRVKDQNDLIVITRADKKRDREDYNSYLLAQEHEYGTSKSISI